jgi:DNA modification methylase
MSGPLDNFSMTNTLAMLLKHYEALEKRFTLIDRTNAYSGLVTAATNTQHPVQRWFHLKEAFSLDLLEILIGEWNIPANEIYRVLDPFCGTGTSLLATQRLAKKLGRTDLLAVGLERNPFLHFVAKTKLGWHTFNLQQFGLHASHLLNGAPKPTLRKLPELSTLHREDVFSKRNLKEVIGFRGAINAIETHERNLLLLGYASVLEDLSGTRKDGRMVRIVKNKQRPTTVDALREAWTTIANDIECANQHFLPIDANVLFGDGRTLTAENNDDQLGNFDLVIYSPPYLNNIDYTEVYKLELWLCGFVNTYEEFRSLRYQTFRSHPSVRFPEPITFVQEQELKDITSTLEVLTDALNKDKNLAWRTTLFNGYFDDMYRSLKHQRDALRDGGWIFCVVGNSLHGSDNAPEIRVPVASDLVIALIGQTIGLEVIAIQVARYLRRRGPDGHLLRESIVVMRKPKKEM